MPSTSRCALQFSRAQRPLVGGERTGGPGYFYAPTVLTDLSPQMPVLAEETFGPVAAVIRVKDADEAIKVANDTPFGLGANMWTRDIDAARELARRIEAGIGVHQRHGGLGPPPAVRRGQAERLRARAFGVRHTRVREHTDGVDRPRPGSARACRAGRVAECRR